MARFHNNARVGVLGDLLLQALNLQSRKVAGFTYEEETVR